jgi:hypothetical protein
MIELWVEVNSHATPSLGFRYSLHTLVSKNPKRRQVKHFTLQASSFKSRRRDELAQVKLALTVDWMFWLTTVVLSWDCGQMKI